MSKIIQGQFNGYCWCGMCGFNAKLQPGYLEKILKTDVLCPDCDGEGMQSFLCAGTLGEMEEAAVDQDEPMQTYPKKP